MFLLLIEITLMLVHNLANRPLAVSPVWAWKLILSPEAAVPGRGGKREMLDFDIRSLHLLAQDLRAL